MDIHAVCMRGVDDGAYPVTSPSLPHKVCLYGNYIEVEEEDSARSEVPRIIAFKATAQKMMLRVSFSLPVGCSGCRAISRKVLVNTVLKV